MESVENVSPLGSRKIKWTEVLLAFITYYFSLFGAHEFAISLAARYWRPSVVLWTLVFAGIMTYLVTVIGGRKAVWLGARSRSRCHRAYFLHDSGYPPPIRQSRRLRTVSQEKNMSLRRLYRERRLTAVELAGRLRALASGKLPPPLVHSAGTGSV